MLSAAVPTATYERLDELARIHRVTLSEQVRRTLIRGLVGFNQDAAAEVERIRRQQPSLIPYPDREVPDVPPPGVPPPPPPVAP